MNKTILIGLDGATFKVLDPLMDDGVMPFLKEFLADGVRGELLSTPHPLTPPAWTTLMTGRNPGAHGIFDFLRAEIRPSGAFFTLNNFRDVQCETIWSIVGRAGGRSISLNFPLMAPPPSIPGSSIIPGLLSWRHLRRNIHPPSLYDELKALPGFSAAELSWDFESEKKALQHVPEEELEPWVRFHVAREHHWFTILKHLLTADPSWNLAAVIFDGVDKLQHGCWRFLDRAFLPAQPSEFELRMVELCREYFRVLDGFIREIVALAGPEAQVFIASDHGFGPTLRLFRVNAWLERNGYLKWPQGHTAREENDRRAGTTSHYVLFDWASTTAYAQSAATNGIHIRLRREDGDGGVAPEAYEGFRARLIDQLLAVRDPVTNTPFFKAILKREEVFPGPHQDKGPDLTLVPFDHGFLSVLEGEPVLSVRSMVMGTHWPEGVFMAGGPGISRGQDLERLSILDIAPTLLHSLGLEVPVDFEGRVIERAFEPAYLREHPVRVGRPTEPPRTYATTAKPGEGSDRSREEAGDDASSEDAMVLDRLRVLGYVE